jgi:hypothetical protein
MNDPPPASHGAAARTLWTITREARANWIISRPAARGPHGHRPAPRRRRNRASRLQCRGGRGVVARTPERKRLFGIRVTPGVPVGTNPASRPKRQGSASRGVPKPHPRRLRPTNQRTKTPPRVPSTRRILAFAKPLRQPPTPSSPPPSPAPAAPGGNLFLFASRVRLVGFGGCCGGFVPLCSSDCLRFPPFP